MDDNKCITFTSPIYFFCLVQDVCILEQFNPVCAQDETILILSALLGRMQQGRCISSNILLGCSVDVTSYISERCQGQSTCSQPIDVTEELLAHNSCGQDLVVYLQVTYACMESKDAM